MLNVIQHRFTDIFYTSHAQYFSGFDPMIA